jgi:hypothetical protein
VEQKLLTLPELLSSPTVFSGVRFTRLLVLCACFVARCLSFFPFSFGHCVVCPSSIDPIPETDLEITQIFHDDQPHHGGDRKTFEGMTST